MTLTLQDATGKSVLLLPIGASDDGAHSQNEKIDRINYINGVSIKETDVRVMKILIITAPLPCMLNC